MYGSTCADMQVGVMGEYLSSIKHVVGTTSGCFTGVESLGEREKLEEARSVTSVAAEFGIAHSIVSRLWRQFQTTGTAIWGYSSGRPRESTPADDRYFVLQARRNRRQTAVEIARHTTQATGRPISRFTVARRLQGGGLFARRPVRCVPLTPAHRRRRSLWCREHRNRRDNEWGRVLFTNESRFSLSSDSHRILIWRERGSRNHSSNIIESDRGAMGLQFLFMDDNAPYHRTVAAEQLLESRRLAARTLPPVTIQELRFVLKDDEWAAMPQQLIDTLILSMGRRCETCLAVRGDHIPLLKTGCFLLDTHHRDVLAFSRIALHATFSIKLLFIPLISLLGEKAITAMPTQKGILFPQLPGIGCWDIILHSTLSWNRVLKSVSYPTSLWDSGEQIKYMRRFQIHRITYVLCSEN
ncbi:transposable element Tcb2 transposase [Trichonephila clavipes]|nr:transposable element Tcb2 transposase [Trichonephila clavipes]